MLNSTDILKHNCTGRPDGLENEVSRSPSRCPSDLLVEKLNVCSQKIINF